MVYHDTVPGTLNGYPVVATARYGERDLVIVHRRGEYKPYVAATWTGRNDWVWGHYCDTYEEAKAVYLTAIWHERETQ